MALSPLLTFAYVLIGRKGISWGQAVSSRGIYYSPAHVLKTKFRLLLGQELPTACAPCLIGYAPNPREFSMDDPPHSTVRPYLSSEWRQLRASARRGTTPCETWLGAWWDGALFCCPS